MTEIKEPKNMILNYLSHHYILDRSIVFIVDNDFDDSIAYDRAFKYLIDFFDEMQPTEKYGFLTLSES